MRPGLLHSISSKFRHINCPHSSWSRSTDLLPVFVALPLMRQLAPLTTPLFRWPPQLASMEQSQNSSSGKTASTIHCNNSLLLRANFIPSLFTFAINFHITVCSAFLQNKQTLEQHPLVAQTFYCLYHKLLQKSTVLINSEKVRVIYWSLSSRLTRMVVCSLVLNTQQFIHNIPTNIYSDIHPQLPPLPRSMHSLKEHFTTHLLRKFNVRIHLDPTAIYLKKTRSFSQLASK